MNSTAKYVPVLAGALALAGWAGVAEAQTVVNMGGSSAGKNFATDVPLNLCDANPLPNQYINADTNKITWSCNRGGQPIIIRYSATGSSDGVNKLLQPAANAASNMTLQQEVVTGCTGPTLTSRPSDSKQYNKYTGCTATLSQGIHMGASDVGGSSFHQTGPLGTNVSPLNDSGLNSVQAVVVPFSLFVGKGVVKLDAAGTGPNGPIDGLSRLQVEKIFNGHITDWKRAGFGTVTAGVLDASSPITLCMRNAGSGTKAAFDETVMINDTEFAGFGSATKVFSSSSSGVLDCLHNNKNGIGYLDADQREKFVNAGTGFTGDAYEVRLDGGLAYDAAATDKKRDLKCGRYSYWVGWRLNRRSGGEDGGGPIDQLMQAYVDNASLAATVSVIPTGAYWASLEEMVVNKNQDKGPLIWKAGDHPECR